MRRLHLALWLILAAMALASCGETDRVQVGALAPSVDFGKCLGDDTHCEQGFPPARVVGPESAPTQCERVEDDGWQVAWWRKLTHLRCAPVGFCDARLMSVAEDGTVWTAGLGQSPVVDSDETLFGLFLVHYDQDGEIVAQEVVETRQLVGSGSAFGDNAIQMAIAADARGHVIVAMVWTEDEAWVGEFDAAARAVGQRVRLQGWHGNMTPGLSVAADRSVLLSAHTSPPFTTPSAFNALAKLDSKFRPMWLQTRALPPSGFSAMLSGGPRIALVGDPELDLGALGVSQVGTLDPAGNLIDLLHVPVMDTPFAVDPSGNLFALAMGVHASIATKMTPQGDILFQVEITGVQDPNDAHVFHRLSGSVDLEGNSLYAMHWDSRDEQGIYSETLTLWQLDAGGERCRVSNLVNGLGGAIQSTSQLNEMSELLLTNDGDLYVRTESVFARLTR